MNLKVNKSKYKEISKSQLKQDKKERRQNLNTSVNNRMNKKLKISLIVLIVLGLVVAIPLIVLSFGRIEPGYVALCYDNIVSNYSSTEVFGPGNHFIGLARQFIRIRQGPIMVNINGVTYTSDYFRLNSKIIVNYQLSSPNDFNAINSFYLNFGDKS